MGRAAGYPADMEPMEAKEHRALIYLHAADHDDNS
jgi:hypothetical protein